MQTQIDTNALAAFALDTFDFNEAFEDDAFGFDFAGQRLYCERKRGMFVIHVGNDRIKLPRC
jgi:hypothetical protein